MELGKTKVFFFFNSGGIVSHILNATKEKKNSTIVIIYSWPIKVNSECKRQTQFDRHEPQRPDGGL